MFRHASVSGVGFWAFFALTIAVETPVYVLLLVRYGGLRPIRAALTAVAVNLLVYPLFVLVLAPGADLILPPTAGVAVAEVAVCVLEAALLRWWLRADVVLAVAAALLANGCSVIAGVILAQLW